MDSKIDYSNLIQNTRWMWTYKNKKVPHHKSFSKQYRVISEQPIRTNCSYVSRKILPQILNSLYRKIWKTESFISKVKVNSHSIQHLIYSKRNCCKTLTAFPEVFPETFPEVLSEAFPEMYTKGFLLSIPPSPFSVLPFQIQGFNDSFLLYLYQCFAHSTLQRIHGIRK